MQSLKGDAGTNGNFARHVCSLGGNAPLTPTYKGDQRANAAVQHQRHDRPDFHRNHGSAALRSTTEAGDERDRERHVHGLSDPCATRRASTAAVAR